MTTLITFIIAFVAFEHFYFLVLEMFLWTTSKGIKTFGLKSKEFTSIYGAYSTKKIRLFYIQSIPAIFTLLILLFN